MLAAGPRPHFQGVVHILDTYGNLVDGDGHVYVGGVDGTRRAAISASANNPGTGRSNISYAIVESHPQREETGAEDFSGAVFLTVINVALLRVTIHD